MEAEQIESTQDAKSKEVHLKQSRFTWRAIPFLLLFLLLIGGTYLIYGNFGLPGEKLLSQPKAQPSPTPELLSSTDQVPAWRIPQNYIVSDANGNLIVGNFKTKKETVIAKSGGKILGAAQLQALSRTGKYLLYTKLPDEILAEFQKNPPYEFYGSNEYELHLVDLGAGNGGYGDTMISTNVSVLMGPANIGFDKDEKGIYFSKYIKDADTTFYYSLATNSADESKLPGYLTFGAAHSPSYAQYVLPEALPKPLSDTAINTTYNLVLFDQNGTKKKVLYAGFISGETTSIFPTETSVFLTREDYVDGPNSICYIEKIRVPQGDVTPLRAQECPPGSSMTNFHDLSLSPDGKLLLAAYSQDTVGTDPSRLGNFLVYDLNSDASQSIAETDAWYGKYFWVEKNEILTTREAPETPITYRVNLSTGEATADDAFRGKTVLGVY